jgi:hypothetical protein
MILQTNRGAVFPQQRYVSGLPRSFVVVRTITVPVRTVYGGFMDVLTSGRPWSESFTASRPWTEGGEVRP